VKSRTALLLGIVLLFGTTGFAQDNPKTEVSANYSYMRFNPQNNNLPGLSAFSLNGGQCLTAPRICSPRCSKSVQQTRARVNRPF
jgi:hypothetical protein